MDFFKPVDVRQKMMKVTFFHQNICCMFKFTRCSQLRGQRSEHILARNPIMSAKNHRKRIVLYGELLYEGLQRGIIET